MSIERDLREGLLYPEDLEQLNEVSLLGLLRTGVITINVTKTINTSKKVQQHAMKLRSVGNELQRDKTPEDANKTIAEGFRTLSDLYLDMEEMIRRTAFISASGGVFSDRTYNLLRKMEKKRR